jgi:hypothetical protein
MSTPSTDSLNRQIQINEWQYNSKMDTVFTLQLLFIGIAIVAVVFYFKKVGQVGPAFTYYVTGLTLLLITAIIINRVFFTSARRDPRFWHRYRFNDDGKKVPSQTSENTFGDFWAAFMGQSKPSCPACPAPGTAGTAPATAPATLTATVASGPLPRT